MSFRQITIFDTTLRDGEQSPGSQHEPDEKLEIAERPRSTSASTSSRPAFPSPRPATSRRVRAIADASQAAPTICGLARCNDNDIDARGEALAEAPSRRIHVFLATSAIHREFKLRMSQRGDRRAGRSRRSRAPTVIRDDIEFSPEDAARTEPDFLAAGRRGGDRGRRHDGQHPGHGRLRHAAADYARLIALPHSKRVPEHRRGDHLASTATTTSASPSPTAWPPSRTGRGRSSARSTASASGPATPRSKKS